MGSCLLEMLYHCTQGPHLCNKVLEHYQAGRIPAQNIKQTNIVQNQLFVNDALIVVIRMRVLNKICHPVLPCTVNMIPEGYGELGIGAPPITQ